MSKLSTAGTSSCALLAIQGWKPSDVELELKYQEVGNTKPYHDKCKALDKEIACNCKDTKEWPIENFYNGVIYPTAQNLGRTTSYAFSHIMDYVNSGSMSKKYIIVTLNQHQYNNKNNFWPNLLKKHGFQEMDKVKNVIGSSNYIFVRNNYRPSSYKAPTFGGDVNDSGY